MRNNPCLSVDQRVADEGGLKPDFDRSNQFSRDAGVKAGYKAESSASRAIRPFKKIFLELDTFTIFTILNVA